MPARIAVSDPLPVFQFGLVAILRDAGLEADAPADLVAWANHGKRKLVLLTIVGAAEWSVLEQLRRQETDTAVVAVLADASVNMCVRALQAGAISVVPRDASPATMRESVTAALQGQSVLPIEVVRTLTTSAAAGPRRDAPSESEREWLTRLAHGTTVNRLATDAGYSERMMYRLLRDLYSRLGAANKMEAIMHARDEGWVS